MMILFILSLLWLGTHACLNASQDISESVCKNRQFRIYNLTSSYMLCIRVPRDHLINNPVFLQNFTKLYIVRSVIKPATTEMFSQFQKADLLVISDTDLDEIPEALGSFANLVDLSLRYNCLEVIRAGAFPQSMSKLQGLLLYSNEIHTIEDNAFSAPSLTRLSLSNNKITQIDGKFKDIPGLQVLDLSSNRLQSLGRDSFRGLTALKRLYLSNNPIQQISNDAFADLTALNALNLKNCGLVSAGWIVRAPNNAALQNVEFLYLPDNSLQTLPNTTFNWLPNLHQFWLAGNPWNCNDDLQFLEREVQNRARLFYLPYPGDLPTFPFCSQPANRRGQPLGSAI